jgi:hypothetical protein
MGRQKLAVSNTPLVYNPRQPLIINLQNCLRLARHLIVNVDNHKKSISRVFNQIQYFFGQHEILAYPADESDIVELKKLLDTLSTRAPLYVQEATNFMTGANVLQKGKSTVIASETLALLDQTGEMRSWYKKLERKFSDFLNNTDRKSGENYQDLLLAALIPSSSSNQVIIDIDQLKDYYLGNYLQFIVNQIITEETEKISGNQEDMFSFSVIKVNYMTSISRLLCDDLAREQAITDDLINIFTDHIKTPLAQLSNDTTSKKIETLQSFFDFLHSESPCGDLYLYHAYAVYTQNNNIFNFCLYNQNHGLSLETFKAAIIERFIEELQPIPPYLKKMSIKNMSAEEKKIYFPYANLKHIAQLFSIKEDKKYLQENKTIRKFLLKKVTATYKKYREDPVLKKEKVLLKTLDEAYENSLFYIYKFTEIPRPHSTSEYDQLIYALDNSLRIPHNKTLHKNNTEPALAHPSKIQQIFTQISITLHTAVTLLKHAFTCMHKPTQNAPLPVDLRDKSWSIVDKPVISRKPSTSTLDSLNSNATFYTCLSTQPSSTEVHASPEGNKPPSPKESHVVYPAPHEL